MKKLFVFAALTLCIVVSAGSALAQSIQGRLGATGKIGFLIPADSDFNDFKIDTDAGFIGGGGLIYGFDKNIAFEFDITHTWFGGNRPSGIDEGEFSITNFAFGAQYRFLGTNPNMVPYAGGGLDILVNDFSAGDVDTVVGIHVAGGVDYFLMRNLALNAEVKAVVAPDADIKNGTGAGGNFDPSSISGTFGVRYFFW